MAACGFGEKTCTGLGFRVQDLGFRIKGSGLRVRVQDLGFRFGVRKAAFHNLWLKAPLSPMPRISSDPAYAHINAICGAF